MAPIFSSFSSGGGGRGRGFGFGRLRRAAPPGEVRFTSVGTRSWTCPEGVTSVHVVCIGGGGSGAIDNSGGGGGGGGLGWKNNIPVTPGSTYTVRVGGGGNALGPGTGPTAPKQFGNNGTPSYFLSTSTVQGQGGYGGGSPGDRRYGGAGGSYTGDGGGSGGRGGTDTQNNGSPGGGGAGGYSGNGGNGEGNPNGAGSLNTSGAGGGGGGGAASKDSPENIGAGGGGVGFFGESASGTYGLFGRWRYGTGNYGYRYGGNGGSGGSNGVGVPYNTPTGGWRSSHNYGAGGAYGGGGGGVNDNYSSGPGAQGAVRIIWGEGRAFPSTNTAASYSETVETNP